MTAQTKTTWRKARPPQNWRRVKLGEIAAPIRGVSYSSSDLKETDRSTLFANLKNIERRGGFCMDGLKLYSGKCSAEQLIKKGDIIIAMTDLTPMGKVIGMPALVPQLSKPACISMDLVKLDIDQTKIDRMFLYYLLRTKRYAGWIKGFANGVNVLHLKVDGITEFEVLMPEKVSDQKRIAEILSAFDDKIELNNKINQTLEQMAQAIFKEWFVKFRFPGYKKAEFVDSELGKIPEGWEVKKLEEIAQIEYGKGPAGKDLKKDGYPVYGANGIIGYYEKYEFEEPQVIVGCRGVVGSLFKTLPKSSITHNSLIINPIIKEKYYLFYLLKQSNLQSVVGGSAQPQITIRDLSQLPMLVVEKDIRNKFENIVIDLEKKLLNTIYENQTLSALRDLLLPKLMRGEIRV